MMSKIETGGPAFPNDPSTYNEGRGMSLRDYFAAKAMQGLNSNHEVTVDDARIAKWAYEIADAMLKARNA